MKDENERRHPSFVAVRLGNRRSSHRETFFGSSVECSNCISLTISRAYEYRSLSENKIMDEGEIIEVLLSPNQFSELITTMNCGVGVPGTMTRLLGDRIERPPKTVELNEFIKEVNEQGVEAMNAIKDLKVVFDSLKLTKADRERVRGAICKMENEIVKNLPFVIDQARRAIGKAVTEAKTNIDAFWTSIVTRLGVKSLQNQENVSKLMENKEDSSEGS